MIGGSRMVRHRELDELGYQIPAGGMSSLPFFLSKKLPLEHGYPQTSGLWNDFKVTTTNYLVRDYRPTVSTVGQRPLNQPVQWCETVFAGSYRRTADHEQ